MSLHTARRPATTPFSLRAFLIIPLLLGGLLLQSCDLTGSGEARHDVVVSIEPAGGGTVTPSADSTYARGDSLTLTAIPNTGYAFSGWTSDVDTSANPLKLQVNQDYALTAQFMLKNYPLVVNIEGGGEVTESVMQADTSNHDYGTMVYLVARADDDYNFDSWEGDADSTDGNKAWVTVDSPKEVTANFVKRTFSLTVSTSGEGSVTVDPDSAEFIAGTDVDLTATADNGWSFERWKGDVDQTDNPLTVSVDSNMTVEAVFTNDAFEGGNGTEALPYQISTLAQLQEVNNYTDSHFELINDIDATATATSNNGNGFRPLGDNIVKFTGSFDGQGFEISNLTINRGAQDEIGLFGSVAGGTIRNLVLTGVDITGGEYTGGLIGLIDGGTVENVSVTGTVEGTDDHTGGLIGEVRDLNQGNVMLTDVTVDADVTGVGMVGGLIGESSGSVRNSSAAGTVTATDEGAGGLIGWNHGSIEESFSTADVTGTENVGGLVGEARVGSTITSSYAQGAVDGNDTVGGLAGANNSGCTISNSYATGAVTGNFDAAGFAGANGGTIETSYWDTQNSGQADGTGIGNSSGITGLTTDQMQGSSAETEMDALDFENVWEAVPNDYPRLIWQQNP